jgi:hypothetical protein
MGLWPSAGEDGRRLAPEPQITPPLVVDGDNDFEVYATIEAACRATEPEDARLYEVIDSTGRRFAFLVDENRVVLSGLSRVGEATVDLEARLRNYIAILGPERLGFDRMDDQSLPVMLGALLCFQRGVKPSRRRLRT